MDVFKNASKHYQFLKQEWENEPPNLEECGNILNTLKLELTHLDFLPTSNKSATKEELVLARNILELGAKWSLKSKNISEFERYMAQLKCYYFDYQNDLGESGLKYKLLGLNLLCLLTQNRVAEFHTELELLPAKVMQNNSYIKHPVSMEQYLMEGNYNKIFSSKGNVPSASYNIFMDILLDTARNEIAACIEKSYDKLSLSEASRMLFFKDHKEMVELAGKRGWNLSGDYYIYDLEDKNHSDDTVPAFELAPQLLGYARELEMIV